MHPTVQLLNTLANYNTWHQDIEQLINQVHDIAACMRPVTPDTATLHSSTAEAYRDV